LSRGGATVIPNICIIKKANLEDSEEEKKGINGEDNKDAEK